jgi:Ser/Thr protein kinase RdoA (MazF antagonist)
MADGIWRLMTYIPGISVDRVDSAERAYEAGRLLGRFHMALSDLDYRFLGARGGIHETPRHLRNLELALDRHRDHAAYHRVRPVAEEILSAASKLTPLPALAERVVHGDPKISNFIFDAASGEGLCLVDLDTLNRMALPLELGDALRSWCNPAGEDSDTTDFSLGFFRAALTGYASEAGRWISPAEAASLVDATMTIMIELAARFCADALNESYFAWDPVRFPSRSEHNRVRAEGQLRAWEACRKMETQLSEVSREVFGLTPR